MSLIMPKHTGDIDHFIGTLKVCNDAEGQWLTVGEFTDALYQYLHDLPKENEATRNPDNSHYTKCAQAPAYFGFITRDSNTRNASYAITDSGRAFYSYYVRGNSNLLIRELVNALCTVTFGKNNYGCGTDSECEPLGILIKSAIILNGITYKEYAYTLRYMDEGPANLPHLLELLQNILDFRANRSEINPGNADLVIRNFSDAKIITYLTNFGLMERSDDGKVVVAPAVLKHYAPALLRLRINNTTPINTTPISENQNLIDFDTLSLENDIVRAPEESINKYQTYINALQTKPFLLLAGISGTGKSRLVRELAFMSCPRDNELDLNPTEPGNYCLIEVKPNWHDSTELLGYYSNLSQRYELTKFIRFVHKAKKNPNVPFFLCLDEMNLAPVEQYFAEFLSVLETRTSIARNRIKSSDLIPSNSFTTTTEIPPADVDIVNDLMRDGLSLPDNLFVIGTVNVDDTTYQFSRKVIDRAFTIEMNGNELSSMFEENNELRYYTEESLLTLDKFKPKYVTAQEALEDQTEENQRYIKEHVPELLNKVNQILKDTPFCVSYRVQNEFVLYLCSLLENPEDSAESKIKEAFFAILLEKILPRIQGDDKLLKTGNDSNVLEQLKKLVEDIVGEDTLSLPTINQLYAKLDQMNKRLKNSYFTNFFG